MRKLRIILVAGLAGCAPEQPVILSVVDTNLTDAQQRAEVARWLPGCRAVSARPVAGRIPRVEITAMCRRVPAGDG